MDDDESIRELCTLVLRNAGHSVETASHGAAGLDRLRQDRYDLIISDVNMPGLDGLEFHANAVNEFPAVEGSFLFMTGGAPEELLAAISGRRLKCLEKPFRISELLDTVEAMMREPLRMAGLNGDGGAEQEEGGFVSGIEFSQPMPSSSTVDIQANKT